VIEDLDITNMIGIKKLNQRILDASWSKFFEFLSYKAERAGRIVIRVNPRGTSKERHFGIKLDRDYNAALNIHGRGLGHPPVPVKRGSLHRIPASAVVAGQVNVMKQEAQVC
ncbi:MAG: IS200/IS605 family accessory protein TnpB-related protein, partial [Promethearchaeota archaeon]